MAHVRYQQTARLGNANVVIERNENWAEDWTWRTVKLIGFIIGSIAVFWWVFQVGSWFGGRTVTPTPPTPPPIVVAVPAVASVPAPPPKIPSSSPTVVKVEPIKVEVAIPLPPPALLPLSSVPKKSGLPQRAW